jgi:hypothetical protein
MSEADLALLRQAAEHTATAAQIAAQLAGLEPADIDAEVAEMFRSSEQALNDWRPPDGWHW